MRHTLIRVALAASLAVGPETAAAQTVPTALSIVVEDPGPAGQECGIATIDLEGSLRTAMRRNGIEERPKSNTSGPYAWFGTTTLRLGDGLCVTTYTLAIRKFGYQALDGISRPIFGSFQYCSVMGMLSGEQHRNRLAQEAGNSFEACLKKIIKNRSKK